VTAGGAWAFLPRPFRAAIDRLGFSAPTPVQSACLPKALAGESFRAVAPTGTGKTLVYMLPAWQAASRGKDCALILLPTRELAYQVSQMLQDLEPSLRDAAAMAIGGHPKEAQLRRMREGWRILIATPGRLLEMLDEKSVSLKHVTLTVLDEFDKLIGMGFEDQIAAVLRRAPAGGQKLLLSATDLDAPAPDEEADPEAKPTAAEKVSKAAMEMGLSKLPLIPVDREAGSRAMEEAFFFLKSSKKKGDLLLLELGGSKGQAIVFVSNREKANHLNGLLRHKGIDSRVLHGHLPQEERANAYQDFREGLFRVLVATDLASRGLDMPEVDLIVNHDLPKHYKDYVHRTGRTARRGRAGRCVSFAGPDEYLPMRNLEKEFPGPIPVHPAFAHRDRWFIDAKRNHDLLAKQAERKSKIRREQGLED
jgi:ATP-dependent RNA helicase RhlE